MHEVASALFLSLLSAAPDPLQIWMRASRTRFGFPAMTMAGLTVRVRSEQAGLEPEPWPNWCILRFLGGSAMSRKSVGPGPCKSSLGRLCGHEQTAWSNTRKCFLFRKAAHTKTDFSATNSFPAKYYANDSSATSPGVSTNGSDRFHCLRRRCRSSDRRGQRVVTAPSSLRPRSAKAASLGDQQAGSRSHVACTCQAWTDGLLTRRD